MIRQGTPEWLAERAKRLTASDFGAALGLNPYCSRQELWRIKMGIKTVEVNVHIQRGMDNEDNGRAAYEVETGVFVGKAGLVQHPAHEWLAASPDGFVGADGLVEIKCPQAIRSKPPLYHVAQCLGQLECTGRAWVDYAQWVDGEGIAITRLHRSPPFWAWAFPLLEEFWACVTDMREPPRKKRPDVAEIERLINATQAVE